MFHPQEALWLFHRLRNVSNVFEVPHPTFNHMDYLYANEPRAVLYNFVVDDVQLHAPLSVKESPSEGGGEGGGRGVGVSEAGTTSATPSA